MFKTNDDLENRCKFFNFVGKNVKNVSMAENKRYFLIWFSGISEDGSLRNGKMEYSADNGRFFNEEMILTIISKNFNLSQTFIKNFKELKESDFMDYIGGRNNPPQFPEGESEFL